MDELNIVGRLETKPGDGEYPFTEVRYVWHNRDTGEELTPEEVEWLMAKRKPGKGGKC